jgi:hypothetical protein
MDSQLDRLAMFPLNRSSLDSGFRRSEELKAISRHSGGRRNPVTSKIKLDICTIMTSLVSFGLYLDFEL